MKALFPIIRTITTEKSSTAQGKGKYTFQVRRDSTKVDIKKAVKEIYGVDVKTVRIMVSPKKTRLVGRGNLLTKRPIIKKAIVTLKEKKTIDPNKIKDHSKK